MEVELVPSTQVLRSKYLALRKALWPDTEEEVLRSEIARIQNERNCFNLVAMSGELGIGFIEARIKETAKGCTTSPVAYLEGWYVVGSYRKKGIGRKMLALLEEWAKEHSLSEIASDTTEEYDESPIAHQKCGFNACSNSLHFLKKLSG